ncbi:MAG: excinuclease ABC subunit UvrA [Acidobacteria bacterium]|nr:excinuclease ABC subunit UvrA [Acidobacteriota bacterium]
MKQISIRGARENNLKNIDLDIPRNQLTVVTGLSGSGKSSLAFDTLYAEGQRRYIESLSTYARQFLEQMAKPDVDSIEGLSPALSIDQKTTVKSVRSTVGTITEIYDYLRLLFSSVGTPHCPNCHQPITRQSVEQMVKRIFELPKSSRIMILAPVVRERKGEFKKLFEKYYREGFVRVRVDGSVVTLENPPDLDKRKNHSVDIVVDRLLIDEEFRDRMENSVRHAVRMAQGLVTVSMINGPEILFSETMACIDCGMNIPTLEPRSFSFNSRFGACPRCEGLGSQLHVNLERLIENPDKPLKDLKIVLSDKEFSHFFQESMRILLETFKVKSATPFSKYPQEVLKALQEGTEDPIQFRFAGHIYRSRFRGLDHWFKKRVHATGSDRRRQHLLSFMREGPCHSCRGTRLRPESEAVQVNGLGISDYCHLTLDDCLKAVTKISLSSRQESIAGQILEEIRHRLGFVLNLGLSYLTLDRKAVSLSSGEAQRIRLATQIGSRLRGVLYVLDEPSIGLHSRDNQRLLGSLKELRDLGNTVIVVEHDEDTIRSADYLVDLGPGAGSAGGYVVARGSLSEVLRHPESLTAQYLNGSREISVPAQRRGGNGENIEILGVRHHNLQNIDVVFPLGLLIAVTGVSGSGKSSLVDDVLYRALSRQLYRSLPEPGLHRAIRGVERIDKVIEIDQSPIGRTPRSNPATYTGVFTPIRELFALLPESRVRGYKPGRFSFNVKGGRCEVCRGDGLRRIEMNFLPDVYVTCEACQRARYNRETLSIKYKGYSIADVLEMRIEKAYPIFENLPRLQTKLRTLLDVGLGYVRLGQSATTLSGGEAQRVKLARELSKRSTGKTLYILDEPTTGLHFEDVKKLLDILNRLVDRGNTVIVIEHNLEVIKCADWIIDLGPEGGKGGGRVVAVGPPEKVVKSRKSHTGRALGKLFSRHVQV